MTNTKKKKKLPRVEVIVWDDAHAELGVKSVEDAQKIAPVRTYSVGFVVAENQHGVVLGGDIYKDHPDEIYGPSFIPHGMIVERVRLPFPPLP
jgi:hypothetical protein